MIQKIREYLNNNPREKEEKVELELMKMGITLYHIFSLLWDKTTRQYTNNFVIYKTQELLEMLVGSLPETIISEELEERIVNSKHAFDDFKDVESIMEVLGAEIDNYPGNQYGLTIDLKIGALLKALNLKGILDTQIFEKYNN